MRSVSPYERYSIYAPAPDANLTTHVYAANETLAGLAHRYYGDWREWWRIADRNDITDARRVEPGTTLLIPARASTPSEEGLESL